MAWRFKASKYKNAAPIVPKPEACIRDIVVGSYQTYGNNIAASAAFMAFNWEHAGSSLAVLPIDDCGRKSKTMPLLHGHTDTITDLHFSPFHDGLLATGSQDCLVKIWHIPEKGLDTSLTNPECTFSHKQRRVETVGFHPTADCLLHTTSAGCVSLWDICAQKESFSNNEHPDVIQSLSWKQDGTILATSCKDKIVRIMDPRTASPFNMSADSHQSIKDSRVVWLGDQNRILTTGFDAARLRQIIIRDLRNFSQPEKTLELDCSTGILMPLFDPDTNMLFLAGKGDTTISYLEVTDKDPYFIEGLRHTGEQTKGACLVPKRALRVMEGEVNRVLQLTSNTVIPIMYQVPRKTYRDFHSDLYPETNGYRTELDAAQWFGGSNMPVPKMSLDPAKRELGIQPIIPRLGPKPFTSNSTADMSFDKVFSVPQAPGCDSASSDSDRENSSKQSSFEKEVEKIAEEVDGEEHENGTSEVPEPEEEVQLREEEPNHSVAAVSTAERRKSSEDASNKLFEGSRSESNSGDNEDSADVEICRMSANRNSIAERRRIYEARSNSTQDEKPQSPLPLIRRESFKNRGDSPPETINESPDTFNKNIEDNNGDSVNFKRPHMPKKEQSKSLEVASAPKRTSTVFGKVSKFRHLKGTPGHKSTHIENVRNISRQIPGECNGFHANADRVAVPLSGPGGKIAVFELSNPGRLPDGVIPSLVNGGNIMDFQWDPFDSMRLAVACDDGIVKFWQIPEGGLKEPTNTTDSELTAHLDKIYFIRYHPLAKDVFLTASYDMTVKLWDLITMEERISLTGHTDQIFDFAWSPCGVFGATVCRDGKIRVFNPRKTSNCVREGAGPIGTRGARIVFGIDGHYLVCTGFDKVSERQISIYLATDLSAALNTVGLDVSPAILMPYYDEDSSTLFATGKGDSTIYAYEITDEAPFICPLSHHRCTSLHQGLSFLTKNHCDVATVEFAKALRLTNTTIEPLSFAVPRIKSELFQDDLFPPTTVTWKPTLSSAEWFAGKDKRAQKISLQPEGMDSLSSTLPISVPSTPVQKKSDNYSHNIFGGKPGMISDGQFDKAKQKEIQKSVSSRVEFTTKLEQDDMEGVDENEWEE